MSSNLTDVLLAAAPANADAMNLYAFLIGSWEFDVTSYDGRGQSHSGNGEIHAGWVLEGRALQDVWMIPRRSERSAAAPQLPVAGNWFGTTLRVYDPEQDAWRIFWIDPATQRFLTQVGRKSRDGIEQVGRYEDGTMSRWSFRDITANSFRWRGERSLDGEAWTVLLEIAATRTS
jgi:hypothetical protein